MPKSSKRAAADAGTHGASKRAASEKKPAKAKAAKPKSTTEAPQPAAAPAASSPAAAASAAAASAASGAPTAKDVAAAGANEEACRWLEPERAVHLRLGPMESLPFLGSASLRVLSGSLLILGYRVEASDTWHCVSSPAGGLPLVLDVSSAVSSGATLLLRGAPNRPPLDAPSTTDEYFSADPLTTAPGGDRAGRERATEVMDEDDAHAGDERFDEPLDAHLLDVSEGEADEIPPDGNLSDEIPPDETPPDEALPKEALPEDTLPSEDTGGGLLEGGLLMERGLDEQAVADEQGEVGEQGGLDEHAIAGELGILNQSEAADSCTLATSVMGAVLRDRLGLSMIPCEPSPRRLGALAPIEWEHACDELSSAVGSAEASRSTPPVIVLCGARNVGKSSFARLLINRLLDRRADAARTADPTEDAIGEIAYLESDLGQSEFSAPGLVALHRVSAPVFGPPHTHVRACEASCFVGAVSPEPDPLLFVRSVQRMFAIYSERLTQLPLIINTCGWVSGLGAQLLSDVLALVNASHVVTLHRDGMPLDALARVGGRRIELDGIGGGNSAWNGSGRSGGGSGGGTRMAPAAAEARSLQLLAYFGALPPHTLALPQHERGYATGAWQQKLCELMCRRPMMVPLAALRVCVLHASVARSEMMSVLNASIVGLAVGGDPAANNEGGADADADAVADADADADGTADADAAGAPAAGAPPAVWDCLGLGLIRSVDVERERLYVLTPIEPEVLARVRVLLRGSLELPVALLQPTAVTGASPYLGVGAIKSSGAAAMKSRNNIVRGPAPARKY